MSIKQVLIDPGHTDLRTGAYFEGMREEDLNRKQATFLLKALATYGIHGIIYDPIDDDLVDIGNHAEGFDAFVSLHLNTSKEHRANYSAAAIHKKHQKPDSLSAKVASKWACAIGKALTIPIYQGEGLPGVMPISLTVLGAVAKTNCPIFFTSEALFMDFGKGSKFNIDRLELAMKAGAAVLKEYIK